jgi:sugar-specific transcriptional regulator TrmB
MDNLRFTAQLPCHKGAFVHGACFDESCNGKPCCFVCLLAEHSKHVGNVEAVQNLVEKADVHYTTLRNIRSNEEPPKELKDLINDQDECLTNLSLHIEKEKECVEKVISDGQKAFAELTNKMKDTIIKELDSQVETLSSSFKLYKSQFNSFYRGDQVKCPEFPSIAEVMNQLNNSNDVKEIETKFKKLFYDISVGNSLTGTLEEKITQMQDKVKDFSEFLKNEIKLRPSVSKLMQDLKTQFETSTSDIAVIFEKNKDNLSSPKLSTTINRKIFDSVIMKQLADHTRLHSWLNPKPLKVKLLYRGSRDGFGSVDFRQKCDNYQHTVTLVESNFGKVFGGYSDQTWNVTNAYKPSTKCFLFSLSDQEMYQLINQNNDATAIYCHQNYGPTFGCGHDLNIVNNCNTAAGYANWGNSYETKGKAKEVLAGAYNFTVKEIEVFAIDFI